MRAFTLFVLSYLSAVVSGGGYQECLGRIMTFQAYQIDSLNDLASQTMGFRCKTWDQKANVCNGKWEPFKAPPDRCNFDEWMVGYGRSGRPKGWAKYQSGSTQRLDIEETAKECYSRFITNSQANTPKVPSTKPHMVQKAGNENYNAQIDHISQLINDAHKTKRTTANQHLWDDYDDTIKKILIARAGDHGPYLIDKANEKLGGKFEIHLENLGKHPGDTQITWETVDWDKTRDEAIKKGVSDAAQQITDFLDDFYKPRADGKPSIAREHRAVIDSFQQALDARNAC